ncbi:MAG: CheC, inhibitor of methylation / FliN fusion protein [Clostridia bacterium]|jgi:flagellar motor switch protein FliN/FliY|nr:CheC, inhibitor of methylation / FliN fusion protein [Clostridia bacterium]
MAAEMLSQEEINALLGSMVADDMGSSNAPIVLNEEEIDALGEIGNISMGTAATTLFTLLNHKVMITTPKVEVLSWEQFVDTITDDLIAVSVDYTEGFIGANLLILKENDVKVIADLMMGGTGMYADGPITDLHLSAIAESMNQMIGSSSTSMAQLFNKKIDISPPQAIRMDTNLEEIFGPKGDIVKVAFRLQIEENIIDSELMQVLPIDFAKELIGGLLSQEQTKVEDHIDKSDRDRHTSTIEPLQNEPKKEEYTKASSQIPEPVFTPPNDYFEDMYEPPQRTSSFKKDVDVKTPQFESFDNRKKVYPKENMDILMDVSLEVSVELGRTTRKIKEILEFGPGSIIELNRLVGEPVDILVNGKFVATGEVVVIDENFGIRITDIINPEDRI